MPTGDGKLPEAEAERQRELGIEQLIEDQARLHRVAYPIRRRNAELCVTHVRLISGKVPDGL